MTEAIDKLYVIFGAKILGIVPGRVSTEVDARFVSLTSVDVLCFEIAGRGFLEFHEPENFYY